MVGCDWRGADLLQHRERLERPLVSDLPERQRRIVLQRTVELRDGDERVVRVERLVIAKRFDDRAAEEVLSATDVSQQRLTHARIVALRRQRAHQRRAHELALLLVEGRHEIGNHRAIGMVFEEAVRDRAETIVGAGARLAHRVLRARIVEAGQKDERAIADVAVGMLGDGLQQRRHRLRGHGPPDRACRAGTDGVIEVAELVDGGLQLLGGNGLRRRPVPARRLLRAGGARRRRGHRKTHKDQAESRISASSRHARFRVATGSLSAIGSLSSFNASCRYVAWSCGNGTG